MEPTGILNCPSGLKLFVAVPGHTLNPFCDGGSGSGCNNENTRELGIHLDLDRPYGGEGLPQQGASMEVRKGEERDGVKHNSSNHTRLSRVQSKQLDEFYHLNHTVDSKQKKELADRLNLRISQVDAWFRNRRLRSKQKSTEMECAYLKECFNKLKEENHRLQLQVEQLRSTSLQLQLQLHRERVVTAPLDSKPALLRLLASSLQLGLAPTLPGGLGSRQMHSDHVLMPRAQEGSALP